MYIDSNLGILHEPLTGRRWDAPQTSLHAQRRATLLARAGVRRGQRVFIHYGNKPEFFADLLALWCLGACPVPVDPRFTAFEVEQLAMATGPAVSIWDGDVAPDVQASLLRSNVKLIDASEVASTIDETLFAFGLPHLDDDALLLFTSGTTGQPKGVVHTHRSLRARWNQQRERLGIEAFARTLCMVPTHYAWGLVGHCLYAWFSGQELILLPAFRQDVLLRLGTLCDDHAVTCLPSVPAMWRVALKMAAPPKRSAIARITSGTSPLPAALAAGVQSWGGASEVIDIYGITETGWLAGATHTQRQGEEAPMSQPWGAVIKVLEGASTRLGPGRLRECEPGEVGHIWVQVPSLMRGYFRRDDASAQVVTRGWFSTGDLGTLDERGWLALRGRQKEMINIGGAKVYPADIDAAIAGLPGVDDVCAFAIEDALLSENIGIALVLAERSERQLALLYRHIAQRLAAHQIPRRWYLLGEIPRTARGKLDRPKVAEHCAASKAFEQRALERLGEALAREPIA